MFISPAEALSILEQYKYLLIFPIMIIEGPIITVISGFLVYLGFLNIYVTAPLLIVGDLIGDALHYLLGKYATRSIWVMKMVRFLGYDEVKEKLIEEHFEKHTGKTLLLAKVSHGVGGIVQVASGMVKVDFYQFLLFCFIGTIPKTLILFIIGFYLGSSYMKIDSYFDFIALITFSIVACMFSYLVLRRSIKNYLAEK